MQSTNTNTSLGEGGLRVVYVFLLSSVPVAVTTQTQENGVCKTNALSNCDGCVLQRQINCSLNPVGCMCRICTRSPSTPAPRLLPCLSAAIYMYGNAGMSWQSRWLLAASVAYECNSQLIPISLFRFFDCLPSGHSANLNRLVF